MISVCLATYNGSVYVGEQLCSVLRQLGPDDEVVVSDDGSTDNTVAVISSIDDDRLRLLEGVGQLGVVRNFERALQAARGDGVGVRRECAGDVDQAAGRAGELGGVGKHRHAAERGADHGEQLRDAEWAY